MWKIIEIHLIYPSIWGCEDHLMKNCPLAIENVLFQRGNKVVSLQYHNNVPFVAVGKMVNGLPIFTDKTQYGSLQKASVVYVKNVTDITKVTFVATPNDELGYYSSKENIECVLDGLYGNPITICMSSLQNMYKKVKNRNIQRKIIDKLLEYLITLDVVVVDNTREEWVKEIGDYLNTSWIEETEHWGKKDIAFQYIKKDKPEIKIEEVRKRYPSSDMYCVGGVGWIIVIRYNE